MKFSTVAVAIWCLSTSSNAHEVPEEHDARTSYNHEVPEERSQHQKTREHHSNVRTGQNTREHHSRNHDKEQEARIDAKPRIVGGGIASPGEYPYFVELGGCGGSLIAPGVVLSAAHCGDYTTETPIIVGGYKRDDTTAGGVFAQVTSFVNHPGWDGNQYDVQLMRLDPPVKAAAGAYLTLNFDSNVPEAGDYMTVIGQGLTSDGGTSSNILKEVSTPFMPFETCIKEEHWGDGVIDATMICAGGVAGAGACQEDSGGPMIVKYGNEHMLVGTVSHGDKCGVQGDPGIFVRTSAVAGWIKTTVCTTWKIDAAICYD